MASPFTVFRKNQRAMMAVVGILCMIAFTIGGVMSSTFDMGRGGTREDPIAVTTVNGPMRESDLQHLRETRRLLNLFMMRAIATAYELEDKGGQLNEFKVRFWEWQTKSSLHQQFGPETEEDVVQMAVLADRAKRMGIVISDDAINQFLSERMKSVSPQYLPSKPVSAAQYAAIVRSIGISQTELFAALRTVLAANRLGRMAFFSTQVTPAQRWDYYRRLNQRANAEVVPINVEDFIDEVPDPTDDELRAFFDKHKETEPDPDSPEHGFKEPKKAAFRNFVAKYDEFVDLAGVTDEEIKKHYEDNKERYRFTDLGDELEPANGDDAKPAGSGDAKPADGEDAKPAGNGKSKPAESDEEASSEESPGETSNDETPDDETPVEQDSNTPSEPKTESQSSLSTPRVKLTSTQTTSESSSALPTCQPHVEAAGTQLAFYAAQDDEPNTASADDETRVTDTAAEEPAAKEPAGGETPKAETGAGQAPIADEVPAETPRLKKPAKKTTQKPSVPAPPQISSEGLLIRDIRQGPKPKYDPLWKVEGSIRKELARQKALAIMTDELNVIQKEFGRYKRNLNEEEDERSAEPDYAALAKDHRLEAHQTELLGRHDLESEYPDLAGTSIEQDPMSPATPRRFVDVAYLLPVNQNAIVHDLAGNRYLFWKTDEKEARVPDFDEKRDDVLRAWKIEHARDLALERAKKLAGDASDAHQPLDKVFGKRKGLKVKLTGEFSWMAIDPMDRMQQGRGTPRLSEVVGVDSPGDDFMREVFNLEAGGVGAALNHTKTIAYVVRVKSFSPSERVLHDLFMIQSYDNYAQAGLDDLRQTYKVWREGIAKEAQLVWKRPADQPHDAKAKRRKASEES